MVLQGGITDALPSDSDRFVDYCCGSCPEHATEPARERWQNVDEIFKAAGIAGGSSVADVGAGDGFLTLRIAPIVGRNGHVFAVDISDAKLQSLKQRVADAHFANVEIVKGDGGDPRLPAGQPDAVIILNSYHEMPRFREVLLHISQSLKPGGRLLIAEPGPLPSEQTRAEQIARHHISSKFVAEEMAQAGFSILEQRERFAQIPEASWYSLVVGQLPSSEEERVAEMKSRVIALLRLNSGDTAADVGSGDGFIRFPWPASWDLPGRCTRRISVMASLGISVSIENKEPSRSRAQVQGNQPLPKFPIKTVP